MLLCDIHMKTLFQKLCNCKSFFTVLCLFLTAAWSYGNAWGIRSSLFIPGCWSNVHNRYWHVLEWRRRTDVWEENSSGQCLDENELLFYNWTGFYFFSSPIRTNGVQNGNVRWRNTDNLDFLAISKVTLKVHCLRDRIA